MSVRSRAAQAVYQAEQPGLHKETLFQKAKEFKHKNKNQRKKALHYAKGRLPQIQGQYGTLGVQSWSWELYY